MRHLMLQVALFCSVLFQSALADNALPLQTPSCEVEHVTSALFPAKDVSLPLPIEMPRVPLIHDEADLYLAVSLSIPQESLRVLAKEAARAGITMVLRGLPLKSTQPPATDWERVRALTMPLSAQGATLQIDPARFEVLRQKESEALYVPALVFRCDAKVNILPGDVRLRWSLAALRESVSPHCSRALKSAIERLDSERFLGERP